MDKALELATDLGKCIAAGERFRNLRSAEAAVEADSDARSMLTAVENQRKKIADLEARNQPIAPEEKREMQRLDEALRSSDTLQALVRAQADYMEMMNRINKAIRKQLD